VTAVNWKSRVNGDWNVAANWSMNTVPTLVNAISISTSRAYIANISNFDLWNYVTFNGSGRAVGKWGFADDGGRVHRRFRLGAAQ
jgi:hypothetical protein